VEQLVSLLPIVGIALLFWLLIIRPQSKRARAVREMQSSLQVGSDVMLTSGVFGTIEAIADDHVRLRIADGVTIKVAKGAVGNVVDPVTHQETTEPEPPPEA
jgi:preprotein translocase subunit YajC